MIVRARQSRSVAEHRAWRRSSTLHSPVVAVAPDTRRLPVLLTEQLAAMGLDVAEVRSRRSAERLERWWRAWTSGARVERVVLVNPQLAHPAALCSYLLLLGELVDEITLLERPGRSDGYEAIMAELEAVTADPVGTPRSSSGMPEAARSPLPRVPRTGTLTFITACQQALPPAAAKLVLQRYDESLVRAREALQRKDPQAALSLLWDVGARSSSPDELLIGLHAIRVAAWSVGVALRFDPHVVLQRAGAALLSTGADGLWSQIASQVDANRATSQCLGVLGWTVDDILSLTIDAAAKLRASGAVPLAVARLLEVATAARLSTDGAAGDERLIVDPSRTALDERTVGRWIRLAPVDHLAPTIGNHLRRRHADAPTQLRDLGLEWADA